MKHRFRGMTEQQQQFIKIVGFSRLTPLTEAPVLANRYDA